MKLNELKDKKILILGFGKEGKDALKFLKKLFPKKEVGVADVKLDKNYLQALKNYDVIIKSPGIAPKMVAPFIRERQKLTSATEIFLQNCLGKIVGITGTKGKSTTSFWIYQTLKKAGLAVKLVGNIGKPALSHLLTAKPKDIFVYELSSHQLYGVKKSPHLAVLLNVYPEHLDYYRDFQEYAASKANIAKYQTEKDYFVYNSENQICRQIAKKTRAQKIPIKGKYYQLDMMAVRAVAKIFGAPLPKNLPNLPHRLELVGEFRGIKFYNDSLSTIPETTIEAMDYLGANVQTLILGGFDRGLTFRNLAKKVLSSKIKNIILFPATGEKIWREILRQSNRKNLPQGLFADNMRSAVQLAYKHTAKGKICLLSPASASFGIFKDYKHRGNLFKRYVKLYGAKRKSS